MKLLNSVSVKKAKKGNNFSFLIIVAITLFTSSISCFLLYFNASAQQVIPQKQVVNENQVKIEDSTKLNFSLTIDQYAFIDQALDNSNENHLKIKSIRALLYAQAMQSIKQKMSLLDSISKSSIKSDTLKTKKTPVGIIKQ